VRLSLPVSSALPPAVNMNLRLSVCQPVPPLGKALDIPGYRYKEMPSCTMEV
jgi:hypothetical protein